MGFTPAVQAVTGNATLTLDLENPITPLGLLTPFGLNFSGLQYWPTGQAPEGAGTQWGDGTLTYDALVNGNTFTGIQVIEDCVGGCPYRDAGIVTGVFSVLSMKAWAALLNAMI